MEEEYIYIKIPQEYYKVYKNILIVLADYGEDMLYDCKASCASKNQDIVDCYNMFNAAIAAKELGKDKLAETLIKYITTKLKQYKTISCNDGAN